MSPRKSAAPFLSRSFLLLFGMNFLFFTGLNLFNVIPPYLQGLGASQTYVGFFMNINSLALVLFVAPLTRFTDHWGRKRLMVISYLLALASLVAMYLTADSLFWLAFFRITATPLFCLAFTVHGAEAFELFPREKRASGAAIFGISGLLSNPVSSLLGESLIKGPGAPFLIPAAAAFLAGAFLLAALHKFHRPASLPEKGAFQRLATRSELRPLLLLTLVFGGGFTTFSTFLAGLTVSRLGSVQVSLFFTAFTVIAVAGRLFFSRFLDHWPKHKVVALCLGLVALALGGGIILREPWLLIPMGLIYGFAHSLLFPLLSTLFVNAGEDHEKLALNSLFASTNTLGNFAWGLGLGGLGDLGGYSLVFGVMGGTFLMMAPVAWRSLRNRH